MRASTTCVFGFKDFETEEVIPARQPKYFRKVFTPFSTGWFPDKLRSPFAAVGFQDGKVRILKDSQEGPLQGMTPLKSSTVELNEPLIDLCWCPFLKFDSGENACYVTTCRSAPIQMWDADDGELRASYKAFNAMDEVSHAQSVAWSSDGFTIAGGYGNEAVTVRLFDMSRPGRETKMQWKSPVASGMVGSVAFLGPLVAAGHCGPPNSPFCDVELFDTRCSCCAGLLRGHHSGVVQITSPPTNNLSVFTGSRLGDGRILAWDLRHLTKPVCEMIRELRTNQPTGFCVVPASQLPRSAGGGVENTAVISTCHSGVLRVFDAVTGSNVWASEPLSQGSLHGLGLLSAIDGTITVAVTNGSRRHTQKLLPSGKLESLPEHRKRRRSDGEKVEFSDDEEPVFGECTSASTLSVVTIQ